MPYIMYGVRVIKPSRIREHCVRYPDASEALLAWLDITQRADWHSIVDVRRVFPHADAVKVRSGHTVTVFNVRGNKYRLIASIKYEWAMVYVLRFLTHGEYDTDKWKYEL